MTTNTHPSKKTSKLHSAASPSPTEPTAAPAVSTSAPSTSSTSPFPVPPTIASLQSAPAGFVAGSMKRFRSVVPQRAELGALPAAISDLKKIPNYALFVGAPPLQNFIDTLTLAGEWSAVRNTTKTFDAYAATQQGNLWLTARPLMEDFRQAMVQVLKAQPALASQLQGLMTFLGIRSAIAKRSASTRQANAKEKTADQLATHGTVGKTNVRTAEKAALAAEDSAKAPAAPAATAAASNGTATNGTSHS
jgi:hypothetical protein